ncbi:hypothetical protein PAXINDRAFT_8576 [Paxillus involutus ATCC 200175]|nr:hypothetical protein PAXINDRAFT_8576 [Paxillus involutus ATCC 200175]
MVVMIILTETGPYCSPKEDLIAWHTFRHHSKCSSFEEFLDMIDITDEDSKWLGLVTVADHTWCHISNVDYYVWVNDGKEKINISLQSSGTVAAHGTLFPKIDMDTFSKGLDPQADTSLLSATDVLWDFNWSWCQARIANAAEWTAHEWFEDWYLRCFRGTKCSIEDVDTSGDYDSTTTSQFSDSSQTSLSSKTPPLTRARNRVAPGSR